MIKNTTQSYGAVSKFLHWTMALLIIMLLAMGLFMTDLPDSDDKWSLYDLHKSFGMVVFALVLFRIIWRYVSPAPHPLQSLPDWQKKISRASHYGLMLFLVLFPLTGLIMSIMGGYPVKVFGLFQIPALTTGQTGIAGAAHAVHVWMPFFAIALISVHFLAAMYHQFYVKDDVLKRMI